MTFSLPKKIAQTREYQSVVTPEAPVGNGFGSQIKVAPPGVVVGIPELVKLRGLATGLGLSSHRIVTRNMIGSHSSSIRGRGMEFDEVRVYQPGDDVQRIDWRVTSRTGKVHTKLFKEERQRPVHLVVDQRSTMFFGSQVAFKSVVAARLAAICAWATLSHHDKVGGVIIGDNSSQFLKALAGKRGVLRLIQSIAAQSQLVAEGNYRDGTKVALNGVLEELVAAAHPGTLIIILSDFHDYDQMSLKYLQVLRRKCDILCFGIYDPMEKSLPAAGIYGVSDGVRDLLIDTRGAGLRKNFEDDFDARIRRIYTDCAHCGVPFIRVSTTDNLSGRAKQLFGGKSRPLGKLA